MSQKAARCGQLECLRYIYENKLPWDELTRAYAARHGKLE